MSERVDRVVVEADTSEFEQRLADIRRQLDELASRQP